MSRRANKLVKYGKWIIGGVLAASTSSVVIVSNCSSPSPPPPGGWSASQAAHVPDTSAKWDSNWDLRAGYRLVKRRRRRRSTGQKDDGDTDDEDNVEISKPKAVRHIVLVRHGQNFRTITEVDSERFLTPLGIEQARLTGQRLKRSGIRFDSVVCSTLRRAVETAGILLEEIGGQKGLELEIECEADPLLCEGSPCRPEPPEPEANWHADVEYYQDGPRIEAAFRKYFHRAEPDQERDSFELIVCHANVIRYFVCRAMQFPGDAWHRFLLHHCSITVLSIRPSGRVTLRAIGDSGHLPVEKMSLAMDHLAGAGAV